MAANRDATAIQVAEIQSSPPFTVHGNRFDNNGAISASRFGRSQSYVVSSG